MRQILLSGSATVLMAALLTSFWRFDSNVEASPTIPGHADGKTACTDKDGDGFGLGCVAGEDCNDFDRAVNPGRVEICNFRDDDCNAIVDDLEGCAAAPIDTSPVTIDAGGFLMGADAEVEDESPAHQVYVSQMVMDRHEVTNRRYQACVVSGACDPPAFPSSKRRNDYFENPTFADYPVIYVNWDQADAFCRFAGGRLPTEAEWEKAARGNDGFPRTFPWGEDEPTCALANMGGSGSCVGDTDRVGRRPAGAGPYGVLDMAGNVWEWVADWYDADYYAESPERNPRGPEDGRLKIMRGGCWQSGRDSLRVSCRKAALPSSWAQNVGFRCAYEKGAK